MSIELVELPARRAVVAHYQGPRSGMGEASKAVYSWVGTYFKERASEVTVCLDSRPQGGGRPDPNEVVRAEVRFDVDDAFPENAILPDGLTLERIDPETITVREYTGPLTGMQMAIRPWIDDVCQEFEVLPGYRQRMLRTAQAPTSPEWRVEVQLVIG